MRNFSHRVYGDRPTRAEAQADMRGRKFPPKLPEGITARDFDPVKQDAELSWLKLDILAANEGAERLRRREGR